MAPLLPVLSFFLEFTRQFTRRFFLEFTRQPHGVISRHTTSYRQLRVKDLPKVSTWRQVESNQRPSTPKAPNTTTKSPRLCQCQTYFRYKFKAATTKTPFCF